LEQITSLLGGRAAEELVFNELTVGAGSDIAQATVVARRMVTEYGMSELGPMALPEGPSRGFLGGFFGEEGGFSESMAARVDDEVKAIIDQCHARARELLQNQREKLDRVAQTLVEKETLEGEDFLKLIS
jgi:cell division protease FtsH